MSDEIQEAGTFDDIYDELQKDDRKTLSASAINTGLMCRRKYWFRYVKGWRIQSKGAALALGTAVHGGVELLNRKSALGKECTLMDVLEEYESVWEEETDGYRVGEEFKTEKDASDTYQLGIGLLDKYFKSTRRKQMTPILYTPPGANVEIPAVEMRLDIPFIDVNTGKSINDEWKIIGYVDVVKKATKKSKDLSVGDLCVLDYKTTAREFTDFKMLTLTQLLLYAYSIRYVLRNENWFPKHRKDREDYVGIIEMLKRKTQRLQHARTRLMQVTDEQIQQIQQLVKDFIDDMENRIWLPNFGDHCSYCDFKEACLGMTMGRNPEDWWERNKKNMKQETNRKVVR